MANAGNPQTSHGGSVRKIIEPLWGGFSSGAGTSISTQGPARVASEGVSMDCRGTGDAGELRPMLIWDSIWLGRSVDGIFYDNLDGWYWVSPFAILAWFTGESSSWQNPTAPFFQKKSCDLIQTFPKKQSSWQEAYQKWFNLIDGGSASTNDMSRASPCGRS